MSYLGGTPINTAPMPEVSLAAIQLYQFQLEEDPSEPRQILYGTNPVQVYAVNPTLVTLDENRQPTQLIQSNLVLAMLRDLQDLRQQVAILRSEMQTISSGTKTATTTTPTTTTAPKTGGSLLNL